MLPPDQLEPGTSDGCGPRPPEVVLVQVEYDLPPRRLAVLRDAAPHVERVKTWRRQRLELCK